MKLKYGIIVAVLVLMLLSACGNNDTKAEKPPEPVDKIYNDATAKLQNSEFKAAIAGFDDVSRIYSYSEWAPRAEIMSAYASYRSHQYDDALATIDRFVKQHPNSSNTPYAYYLKTMCYYEQITDVGRDQKTTTLAQQALADLISRFPDSEYARDARIKLDLVMDHLAGKEMEIGRYYERHQEYLAAINRFRKVVEKYQTTSHTPEALHRLVECYLKLGVKDQAQKYAAVLGYNYPASSWYKDTYALMNGKPLPEQASTKGRFGKLLPF